MTLLIPTKAEPVSRRWTKAEYYQLADLGFFSGQKAELIEGEIMVQSPQKAEHFRTTERVAEALTAAFGAGFHVRMQGPLDLGQHTEPEPDVAVVPGHGEDYRRAHPTTAVLVVEVSDTTLDSDQTRKASLYARAGVTDYWIMNLVADQVEMYRDPVTDSSQPYGHRYSTARVYFRGSSLSPLAKSAVLVPVASLLG